MFVGMIQRVLRSRSRIKEKQSVESSSPIEFYLPRLVGSQLKTAPPRLSNRSPFSNGTCYLRHDGKCQTLAQLELLGTRDLRDHPWHLPLSHAVVSVAVVDVVFRRFT